MQALASVKRIVIKVGSSLLAASPAGRPAAIADEIANLSPGVEVVVVSSGAISLGTKSLGLKDRPDDLPRLQAAAAIGQTQLMRSWEHAFAAHSLTTAQVLLTHDDLSNRRRFINARNALRALLDAGVIPIINENDTVAVEEIKYGDNDLLAALVCNLITADALILLTDVDGLHDADPADGGVRIPIVRDIDSEATPVPKPAKRDGVGSGGMASKVQAARSAAHHGVATIVVAGDHPGVIASALAGHDVGTLFVPPSERINSRKHWIAYGSKPSGQLVVDDGAHRAVADSGKSLLPAGIVKVVGHFEMGELVSLVTSDGTEFARGLAAYSAFELSQLKGLQTTEIEAKLGYKYLDEAIHRDDLVLI